MPLPTLDAQAKAASDAAERFVDDFYDTLNKRRNIEPFYVNACTRYTSLKADISINGLVVPTPADFQAMIEKRGPGVHYEVESFDAHCINPDFNIDAPDHALEPDRSGAKGQLLVSVVGRVRYARTKALRELARQMAPDLEERLLSDPMFAPREQNFTDVFVLVPNWDTFVARSPRRRQLILSHKFREL